VFLANHTNDVVPTLNVDGIGAVEIKSAGGNELISGDLSAGLIYVVRYTGSVFQMVTAGISDIDSVEAAAQSAFEAEAWANTPEDQLVADPPGNGVDEYSALHWAKKAEADAVGTLLLDGTRTMVGPIVSSLAGTVGLQLFDTGASDPLDYGSFEQDSDLLIIGYYDDSAGQVTTSIRINENEVVFPDSNVRFSGGIIFSDGVTAIQLNHASSTQSIRKSGTGVFKIETDNAAGEIQLSTGLDVLALTIDANQDATFAGNVGIAAGGHLFLQNDNQRIYFGAADDSYINYSGSNLWIWPDILGTGGQNDSLIVARETAGTSDQLQILKLRRTTSGTAANGIGAILNWGIHNDIGDVMSAVNLSGRLINVTDGAEQAALYVQLLDEVESPATPITVVGFTPAGVSIGHQSYARDWKLEFHSLTNDGIITWKDTENQFLFDSDIAMDSGAQIILDAGVVGAPSIVFDATELDTGFYRSAADQIGVSIAGSEVAIFNAVGLIMGVGEQIQADSGTNSAPGIYFGSVDINTGFYRIGTDNIGVTINSEATANFNANGLNMGASKRIFIASGTAALPSVTFVASNTTGMYRVTTDVIGFSVGTALKMSIDSTGISVVGDIDGDTVSGGMIALDAEAITGTADDVIMTPDKVAHRETQRGPYCAHADLQVTSYSGNTSRTRLSYGAINNTNNGVLDAIAGSSDYIANETGATIVVLVTVHIMVSSLTAGDNIVIDITDGSSTVSTKSWVAPVDLSIYGGSLSYPVTLSSGQNAGAFITSTCDTSGPTVRLGSTIEAVIVQ
jgi:hypothetical protein